VSNEPSIYTPIHVRYRHFDDTGKTLQRFDSEELTKPYWVGKQEKVRASLAASITGLELTWPKQK
jgi:hypothetical protein